MSDYLTTKKTVDNNAPELPSVDEMSKFLDNEKSITMEELEEKQSTKEKVAEKKDTKGADRYVSSGDHADSPKSDMPDRLDGKTDMGLSNSTSMENEEPSEDYGGEEGPDNALQSGESFWCSLCDDGGNLLFCDGPCLRSFHACLSEQEGKDCKTLGFTEKQFKAIENELSTWLCPNCEANSQLCFLCGKLGKSAGPKKEVFNCDAAHCGKFYHPMCVARVHTEIPSEQKVYADGIQQGLGTFLCPSHTCKSCKKLEDGTESDMQFAKCRRCPTGWHIQCLPSTVSFKEDEDLGIQQRAWGVPVGEEGREFVGIYCPKHGLPLEPSDMVQFPHSPVSRFKLANHFNQLQEAASKKSMKPKEIDSATEQEKWAPAKEKRAPPKIASVKVSDAETTMDADSRTKVRGSLDVQMASGHQQSSGLKHRPPKFTAVAADTTPDIAPLPLPIDIKRDIKRRVDEIIAKSQELRTVEDVKKVLCTPRFYGDKKFVLEGGKFIHDGELSSILNSIPKALNWLTKSSGIAEAKCLCPVNSIIQLDRVEKALKVYLNPCLHGQRYTSFGRHFTTKEKLVEVVDRLQWYIDDRDMVVDFCCGANDFSVEVNCKLTQAGKKNCEFRNYDILAPKNNFHFDQRDWFTVEHGELPLGDRLVMGLNPPFGVRAAIANSFIDFALTFRPKIIMLIVPKETRRLEGSGYELIWADPDLLRGKSFYLPGSVNTDETMMDDWNKRAPPLYLWSRSDWADKHRQVALQHGHLKTLLPPLQHLEGQRNSMPPHFLPMSVPCNPLASVGRPPPWPGLTFEYVPLCPPLPNMGRPSGLRPAHASPAHCFHPESTANASGSVWSDRCSVENRLPSNFTVPDTNGLPVEHPDQTSPVVVGLTDSNAESDESLCTSLKGSPQKPLKAEDTPKEFAPSHLEVAPSHVVADVEVDAVVKPAVELSMSNSPGDVHPTKSKSVFKPRDAPKRPLKTDALLEKGDDESKQAPSRPRKLLKSSHPSFGQEPGQGLNPTLQGLESSHSSKPQEKPRPSVPCHGREAVDAKRGSELRNGHGRGAAGIGHRGKMETAGDFVNRIDVRSRSLEKGRAASLGGDGFSGVHCNSGDERRRVLEGEELIHQESLERRRLSGSIERRAFVDAHEESDKEAGARGRSQERNDKRDQTNIGKWRRSVEGVEVKVASDVRMKRISGESNLRNDSNSRKTTLCVEELDAERDQLRTDNHAREDADKGHSGTEMHVNGEDVETGQSIREDHGWEDTETRHLRQEIHGRNDSDDSGHSRRETIHGKNGLRVVSKTNFEAGEVRDPRDLGGIDIQESGRDLRGFGDDMDLEDPREFDARGSYCTGEEPTGIALPKWFTTQAGPAFIPESKVAHSIQDTLPPKAEADPLETAPIIKYPTLHGSYGVRDHSPPRAFPNEYPSFLGRSYGACGEPSLPPHGAHFPGERPPPDTHHALEFPELRGRSYGGHHHHRPPPPPPTHTFDFSEHRGRTHGMRPPSQLLRTHSFEFSDLNIGRGYGAHDSPWRAPMGSGVDMHRHHPQDMPPGWPRSDLGPHLYPDSLGGVPAFLGGLRAEMPMFPLNDEPLPPYRTNFSPGLPARARDFPHPPPSLCNDFLGMRNPPAPSLEGLWNPAPFPYRPPPANMGPHPLGMAPLPWREPRPYFNPELLGWHN